ncbi:hypothetical protein [Gynuella sp.]|uniref:aldose epimerase family protein n=1 Tax=Gynuella sp. TaxID=2969146 RepID=UPI003D13C7DA
MIKEYIWQDKPCLELNTPLGQLQISLWGGQLLQWVPKNAAPVFWLSRIPPQPGKPIRGGIPVCWPWFGGKEGYESHGWARTSLWTLEHSDEQSLTLSLSGSLKHLPENSRYEIKQRFVLNDTLTQILSFKHEHPSPVFFQTALHSYFSVSHPSNVQLKGLEDKTYKDKLANYAVKRTPNSIDANLPWDATISNMEGWELHDSGLNRLIKCQPSNADTTVLWHPSDQTTQAMTDIHPGGNSEYLCLETANLEDISVPPGQQVTLAHTISVTTP